MGGFHEGQQIWIEQPDGSQRPGIFVGDAQNASWFGGQSGAMWPTRIRTRARRSALMRITPREEDGEADATRPG